MLQYNIKVTLKKKDFPDFLSNIHYVETLWNVLTSKRKRKPLRNDCFPSPSSYSWRREKLLLEALEMDIDNSIFGKLPLSWNAFPLFA
jgi:hypothetical protein